MLVIVAFVRYSTMNLKADVGGMQLIKFCWMLTLPTRKHSHYHLHPLANKCVYVVLCVHV